MKEDGFDRWAFVLVVFAILAVAIGSCAWNVSLYEECRQDGRPRYECWALVAGTRFVPGKGAP